MFKKILLTGLFFSSLVSVYAAAPTLSLSNSGTGDSVLVSVTGDPNSSISLAYYSTAASGVQTQTIGTTNGSGTFWTLISTSAYHVSTNGSVYVTVNGQQSTQMTWPYTAGGASSGVFSLNQTGLVLSVGQTSTITATNGNSIYLFNNTNPAVVNVSISGNQINVSANSNGSTVFTICSGSSSNCVSVYVTVQTSGAQLLTFSQSNVTLATGQTLPISIYGGSGTYTVVSNSNVGIIQANLNGSTVNLYGNSGSGQSSITICTVGMTSCGLLNVTIGTISSSPITFSQTSPSLSTGQTMTVSISGSSGTYSISSNSNPGSVQASISGGSLTLYGASFGTATIVVCSSTGSCGSLTPTVSSGGGGGAITLSQTNLVLVVGQTASVTVSGGSVPYNIPSTSGNNIQTSLNGNILTVTGVSSGTNSVNVCSAGGGCVALSIVVNTGNGGTIVNSTPGFSQSIVTVNAGQSATVSIIGSGGYYIAGNTNSGVAGATISGSSVVINGNIAGSTVLTVCQSTSQCNTISVTVGGTTTTTSAPALNPNILIGQNTSFSLSGGSSYYLSSSVNTIFSAGISGNTLTLTGLAIGQGQVGVCSSNGSCTMFTVTVSGSPSAGITPGLPSSSGLRYIFNSPLTYGAKGSEVVELQKRLHEEGYFNGSYANTYGEATLAAVKKFQRANGLSPLGNLGPSTRALLNK